MTDTELIDALVASCRRQLDWYRALLETAQLILGKLALSRGDLTVVAPAFRQKQELLESVAADRRETAPLVTLWQERKEAVRKAGATTQLDEILAETEGVLKRFLDQEEQIKRYLERAVKNTESLPDGR